MSGSIPNGQRALFANAPVLPPAQTIPTVPAGSNLAAAMMQNTHPNMQQGSPISAIPLASMMNMFKPTPNPTPGNNQTGLVRGPDGSWVAGPSMGGAPVPPPQPQTLSWASDVPQQQPPMQGPGPAMPGGGAPGMPSAGAVGMPAGPAPGTPTPGAAGVPSAGQPGLMGQTMNWLQNLYGGGGSG
jgi:hypothetical protein